MNDAFIFSQLWIIIVTRSTNDHDQKGLAMLPEISFLSVSQRTSSTSLPFDNLTQHSYQRYDESRLLKERNRRFQHYQRRKGLLHFNYNYYYKNTTH